MQDRQRVPGFARLYAALRTLQSEIEEVMLDFEGHMDLLRYVPSDQENSTCARTAHGNRSG